MPSKPKHLFTYRTQYDVGLDEEIGRATVTVNEEPSLTQQQFVEDCDINVLARRFGLTDSPMPMAPIDPRYYGDFTDVPDLRTALDLVNDARNRFMELPAKMRERFNNQPGRLWEFVNDPENAEEAVRLGLLARSPETPPESPQEPKKAPEPGA